MAGRERAYNLTLVLTGLRKGEKLANLTRGPPFTLAKPCRSAAATQPPAKATPSPLRDDLAADLAS